MGLTKEEIEKTKTEIGEFTLPDYDATIVVRNLLLSLLQHVEVVPS